MDPLKLTCSQQLWLHSSVGRALHRYRRGHGFESRWSLNFFFFQASLSQLLKLRINREDLSWRHLFRSVSLLSFQLFHRTMEFSQILFLLIVYFCSLSFFYYIYMYFSHILPADASFWSTICQEFAVFTQFRAFSVPISRVQRCDVAKEFITQDQYSSGFSLNNWAKKCGVLFFAFYNDARGSPLASYLPSVSLRHS